MEKPIAESLFKSLMIGGVESRNRIFLAPMSVCYADQDGLVTQAEREHYGRRAKGGCGVIVTENFAISKLGRQLPYQTSAWSEEHLPGLASLAHEIKGHGALAIMQIVHAGRYAGPWSDYESAPRLAPSAIPFTLQPGRTVTPTEMSEEQIVMVIEEFAATARLAERAGFDGVEIHGAQGFLISQFLSSRINRRTDRWGIDRTLFAREILNAVRQAVRPETVVGWHMLSDELVPGGYTAADAVALAGALERGGVDFLIPVAGTFEAFQLPENRDLFGRKGFQLDAARQIARAVSIPVIANGGLGTAQEAAALVASGEFAAIGLARPLLADPDWAAKVRQDRAASICGCRCGPPLCLQTQLTGVRCASWPAEVQAQGYSGYAFEATCA